MEVKQLGFMGMLIYFQVVIAGITDPRSASNASRYSLKDAILWALAAFFRQNESFLEYQRQLNSRCGRDNAQSLFGLVNIPTVEQIRNILDGIAAKHLFPWFRWIEQGLKDQGYLRGFEALDGNLLAPAFSFHPYPELTLIIAEWGLGRRERGEGRGEKKAVSCLLSPVS